MLGLLATRSKFVYSTGGIVTEATTPIGAKRVLRISHEIGRSDN
jgi:hypothetical protein